MYTCRGLCVGKWLSHIPRRCIIYNEKKEIKIYGDLFKVQPTKLSFGFVYSFQMGNWRLCIYTYIYTCSLLGRAIRIKMEEIVSIEKGWQGNNEAGRAESGKSLALCSWFGSLTLSILELLVIIFSRYHLLPRVYSLMWIVVPLFRQSKGTTSCMFCVWK